MLSNKRDTAELTETSVINISGAVSDSRYQYISLNVIETLLFSRSVFGNESEYNVFIGTQ